MDTITNGGNASENHHGYNSANLDARLNGISRCESRSSMFLYVPEKVDIDEILAENAPDFPVHKDELNYILSLISSIPSKNLKFLDSNGYTSINRKVLQKTIYKYRKCLDYLISQGILEESAQYIPGFKSKGVKFTQEYLSPLKAVEITKPTLLKSITGVRKKVDMPRTEELSFLKRNFDDLTIDVEGAIRDLSEMARKESEEGNCYAHERLNCRLHPILELHHKSFAFGVDTSGGRLHTPLTRLKSELRKHVTYKGESLFSIDVVNSQPFLTRALFFENNFIINKVMDKLFNGVPPASSIPIMILKMVREARLETDTKMYLKSISEGNFYEDFGKLLVDNGSLDPLLPAQELRKRAKDITFSSIYSPNEHIGFNPTIRIFADAFPTVYEMFKLTKTGKGKHNRFPLLLQKIESDLMLRVICKKINKTYPQIPLFTIHDSIITTEPYIETVRNFINKYTRKYIGKEPTLKIEKWE
ncbi:hypothetical protein EIZ47_10125 [Chryseobacterium lacus]|uniref:DNA-directed DNA polymerase family A palm domain-containing protein n=1 Tax=Chryseobacterium lacus TaxID=2058346 RepID=A0A368MWR9_9FLAO|nr:hypothetical protein [Chryseobacterium lacus]RCU42293.1 hypothetical protein DQ356_10220 [Chryseobacterium lacus]RST26591.1 hypothetical protein EIZ47_10125 [Chryseobacterium lacus]